MDVVGYVRVSLDCAVDDVLDRAAQVDSIERWARRNGHRLVGMFIDEGATASGDLSTRLALSDAIDVIRNSRARALVVARLERLASTVLLQEELFAEIVRMEGTLCSTVEAEALELGRAEGNARDETRALLREAVRDVPLFRSSMRDLWVRHRIRKSPRGDDTEEAAMARIEELAEQGLGARAISHVLSAEGFRPRLARAFNIAGLARTVNDVLARRSHRDTA